MTFDPNQMRENLLAYKLNVSRRVTLDRAREMRALEGYGTGMLQNGIECLLIGMYDVGFELLQKGRQFLQAAIDESEIPRYYFHGGTEASICEGLALCHWFLDRRHDLTILKAGVRWQEICWAEKTKPDKTAMQLTLPLLLDAQEYIKLIERYEQAGLKKPSNVRRIQGQGTMCYAIARQRLGLDYTAEEVAEGLERFLQRRVPIWLGPDGNYDGVALWMKIAHWRPGDDPIATLLKSYTYLDGLAPPQYP